MALELPPVRRSASLIVCDDVRMEMGNKMCYMGVYGSDIVVAELPRVLPRLCLIPRIRVPATESIGATQLVVCFPEAEPMVFDLPQDVEEESPDRDVRYKELIAQFCIERISIQAKGRLSVLWRFADGDSLEAGSLQIRVQESLKQDAA